MSTLTIVLVVVAVLVVLALSVRVVQQYERGVLFRLGRVIGVREPGLTLIIPLIEVLRRVSLRIVTMPIQSQGIITHDNVSIDVSAVAYYRVTDATKAVVAIENVAAAIDQIAQTTLRKVVGQHTLDQTLAETDTINTSIREILDGTTEAWGVVVTLVELKDIQLPETMQRAVARQAEAEREKRAKIIAAEGEQLAADQLGAASDVMMAHPLALQLRNLQSLVEIGVDKNTTVVFPAPLMSTIQELGNFLAERRPPPPHPRHRHHPPSPPGCRRRTTGPTDRPPPLVTSPPIASAVHIGSAPGWSRGRRRRAAQNGGGSLKSPPRSAALSRPWVRSPLPRWLARSTLAVANFRLAPTSSASISATDRFSLSGFPSCAGGVGR
jgi:regulator of protease activity HflC (stomatin/prohibitin superfamily)